MFSKKIPSIMLILGQKSCFLGGCVIALRVNYFKDLRWRENKKDEGKLWGRAEQRRVDKNV